MMLSDPLLQDETTGNGAVWEIPDPVDPKQSLLAPPSGIFFTNGRGYRVHVRFYLPITKEIRAVIFFSHGYSAHINRRWCMTSLFELLQSRGIAVIAHDHENHGYSGGAKRMYVSSVQGLVDDWLGIIEVVRSGSVETFSEVFGTGVVVDSAPATLESIAKAPYVLMGKSMGGLVTQLAFQRLKRKQAATRDDDVCLPVGVVFLCPLLSFPSRLPFHFVTFWLIYALTYFIHRMEIPKFLTGKDKSSRNRVGYAATEQGRSRVELDRTRGLGTLSSIHVGTFLAFVHGVSQVRLQELENLPVLTFHDPEDAIVPYKCSSQDLFEDPCDRNNTVEIVPCPNQGHNLLHSRDSDVVEFVERVMAWVDKVLEPKLGQNAMGQAHSTPAGT